MSYDIISTRKRKTMKIVKPIDIYNAIKRYGKKKQEYFIVITLNSVKDIIAIHIATIGLVNQTIIHAREIFKHVFLDNAVGLIVAHNHPSKAIQPSNDDIEITKHISKVSKIMGIHFLDHLIINQKSYYSFRQNGKML
jgi:DNA repair proteins